MKTEVTKLLGIEYPIIQGGMAWVATHELASAVSNAGRRIKCRWAWTHWSCERSGRMGT